MSAVLKNHGLLLGMPYWAGWGWLGVAGPAGAGPGIDGASWAGWFCVAGLAVVCWGRLGQAWAI